MGSSASGTQGGTPQALVSGCLLATLSNFIDLFATWPKRWRPHLEKATGTSEWRAPRAKVLPHAGSCTPNRGCPPNPQPGPASRTACPTAQEAARTAALNPPRDCFKWRDLSSWLGSTALVELLCSLLFPDRLSTVPQTTRPLPHGANWESR